MEGAWEVIKSHKRKDKYEVTLTHNKDIDKYEVDMWTPNDMNHWHKWFARKEQAEEEFNRWRD